MCFPWKVVNLLEADLTPHSFSFSFSPLSEFLLPAHCISSLSGMPELLTKFPPSLVSRTPVAPCVLPCYPLPSPSALERVPEGRKFISNIQTITSERLKDYLAEDGNLKLLHTIIYYKVIILNKFICWNMKEHGKAHAIAGNSFKLIEDVF